MMIKKTCCQQFFTISKAMWLASFSKVVVFKGDLTVLSQPKSFRKERCVHSAFRHDFSHNEALLENTVFLNIICIYICRQRQITLQIRKEEAWQRNNHRTKRPSILTKGCFPKMICPTLSWLPAFVMQDYLGTQLIFENRSMGLYICFCWSNFGDLFIVMA